MKKSLVGVTLLPELLWEIGLIGLIKLELKWPNNLYIIDEIC